eukprot:754819-Hanusia_phi.AAC.4
MVSIVSSVLSQSLHVGSAREKRTGTDTILVTVLVRDLLLGAVQSETPVDRPQRYPVCHILGRQRGQAFSS